MKQDSDDQLTDLDDLQAGQDPAALQDRIIRRRSSKACDQCRKAKCKCERGDGPNDPCKTCMQLGVECTFLGPSRKRGPAKGYLSALEEEKHQMEALIGTLLASQDHRARTLIQDIVQDPLAREVLSRVDRSIVGTQGRLQGAGRWSERNEASKSGRVGKRMTGEMASSTYEWQDHLLHIIATSPSAAAFRSSSASSSRLLPGAHNASVSPVQPGYHPSPPEHSVHQREPVHHSHSLHADPGSIHPSLAVRTSHPSLHSAYVGYPQQNPGLQSKPGQGQLQVEMLQPFSISREEVHLDSPRQRRRIENSMAGTLRHVQSAHSLDGRGALSWAGPTHRSHVSDRGSSVQSPNHVVSSCDSSDFEDCNDAMGHLSLDDNAEVRYHGKASGLHLLGPALRNDTRQEGGVWRFPPARVWPSIEPGNHRRRIRVEDYGVRLPSKERQAFLLQLFFIHVNTSLPLFIEGPFMDAWHRSVDDLEHVDPAPDGSGYLPDRLPLALLLVIFSIAERLTDDEQPVPKDGTMWAAGESYLSAAKHMITANPFAASRASTCQAYLLIAWREIGIGATSQAYIFLGAAIRMAQDMGLNRNSAKFQEGSEALFTDAERELRNRIWWGALVLDKYVSSYLGKPTIIFGRDFDTPPPVESEAERCTIWEPHHSRLRQDGDVEPSSRYIPGPGRVVSCFAEAGKLAAIVSQILEGLYSIKQAVPSRHREGARLEELLDKWLLALPDHLKLDINGIKNGGAPPAPHILILHMQYWNAVLLLHRPFIRKTSSTRRSTPASGDLSLDSEQQYAMHIRSTDISNTAARHIASLGVIYMHSFSLGRSSCFLSYYVFSAGITHVVALSTNAEDIQAAACLQECMDVLSAMRYTWPSAGRAWDLLYGCRAAIKTNTDIPRNRVTTQVKRHADEAFDDYHTQPPHPSLQQPYVQSSKPAPVDRMSTQMHRPLSRPSSSHLNTIFPSTSPYGVRVHPVSQEQPDGTTYFSINGWGDNPSLDTPGMYSQSSIQGPLVPQQAPRPQHMASLPGAPQAHLSPQQTLVPAQSLDGQMWGDPYADSNLLSSNYYGLPIANRRSEPAPVSMHMGHEVANTPHVGHQAFHNGQYVSYT